MRTTIDLPDELHKQALAIARDTHRTLSETVADNPTRPGSRQHCRDLPRLQDGAASGERWDSRDLRGGALIGGSGMTAAEYQAIFRAERDATRTDATTRAISGEDSDWDDTAGDGLA
jgi:hypothetical protein